MKSRTLFALLLAALTFGVLTATAQDKTADLKLSFELIDSVRTANVTVTSADAPVPEVEVKLYVKRLFSLLPIGKGATTDENGVASFEFPTDLPADMNGKLTVIAKIEDDENYGNAEVSAESDWGAPRADNLQLGRSIYGSRANAPIYFIVVSNLIIIGIWGTMLYVVLQIFKIRRMSKHLHPKN